MRSTDNSHIKHTAFYCAANAKAAVTTEIFHLSRSLLSFQFELTHLIKSVKAYYYDSDKSLAFVGLKDLISVSLNRF